MKNKFLGFFLMTPLILFTFSAQAQETAPQTDILKNMAGDYLLIIGGLVILITMGVLFRLSSILLEMQRIQMLREHGIEVAQKTTVYREPWWDRMKKRWTKVVPIEKERDILLDHDYDGIHELDNSLPPWWVAMFYLSILFAVVYLSYYHFSGAGPNQHQQFTTEMKDAEKAVKAYLETKADLVDETNVTVLTDEASIASGKALFLGKGTCVTCHGQHGEGGIGPNLTDPYWLHGGSITDIFRTIKYGVPEKGMIAWKSQLRAKEMHELASYILTLQGTNPPNPKEPQGDIYQAENETGKSIQDSTSSFGFLDLH